MTLFFLGCIAFVVSAVSILVLRPVCLRLDHVDHPGGRKRHDHSTPLSGGIAIAIAILGVGALVVPSTKLVGFGFGVCILLVLGAIDDHRHVPARLRLAMQTLAVGVGMCLLGGVHVERLGNLVGTGPLMLNRWSIPFTIFAAVGAINAVNMIDGIDGLAGGFAAVLIGLLIALTAGQGAGVISQALLYLSIGSVLGFLAFNARLPWQSRARVFLGDAGSLILGYMLAWFSIEASQEKGQVIEPISIVWLFGLPLCDTLYLMGLRMVQRRSPFEADRYHFHHLLLRMGFSVGWALFVWLAVAVCFMAVGVAGHYIGVPQPALFYGFLVTFAGYCLVVSLLWSLWRVRGQRAARRARRT